VRNVRQMITTRQQAERGRQTQALPLFLVTLEQEEKSQQIFKLTHLNHIITQVETYRARTGLTQCYNCQQFGHAWANCKQPTRCLWCGGGHRHKECPEKDNESSSPSCWNCKLAVGKTHIQPTTGAASWPRKKCFVEHHQLYPKTRQNEPSANL
jgi:hypothetical protein